MNVLAKQVIDAHGGLDRWNAFASLTAELSQRGALWGSKGHPGKLEKTTVTVGLRSQVASHWPFGSESVRSRYTPDRVALETSEGKTLQELDDPRSSFKGHTLETPWSDLQLAYFAGCAMWTYLNMPFLLSWPRVESEELPAVDHLGRSLRRLRVHFPSEIATHSTVQTLYIDDNGLISRHDYDVEIAGNTPGAHVVQGYTEVQGLLFPTNRRIFPRLPDGGAASDPLVVSIDLSNIELKRAT